MKKLLIIVLFISLIFISACTNFGKIDVSNLSEEDVNKIIKCDKPYIRFATGCCLDANDNKICDDDENGKTQSNQNIDVNNKLVYIPDSPQLQTELDQTCNLISQKDSNGYYCDGQNTNKCTKDKNGHYYLEYLGKIIGKCGVAEIGKVDCSAFILSIDNIKWEVGTLSFDISNLESGTNMALVTITQDDKTYTKKLYLDGHSGAKFSQFFAQAPTSDDLKMDKSIFIKVNLIDQNDNLICSPVVKSWSR